MNEYFDIPTRQVETGYTKIDGHRIRTLVARSPYDTGKVPLLLFNGFAASLETLHPLLDALADRTLYSFDVPGVGGSPAPSRPIRMRGLANLAASLLDHWQLDTVDVLGFSWGGFLAQEFAYRFQDHCNRLVLAATSAGTVAVPGAGTVVQMISSVSALINPGAGDVSAKKLHETGLDEDEKALLDEYYALHKPKLFSLGHLYHVLSGYGWTSAHWLHRLPQPTLILAGTRDPFLPIINARYLALQIPESQLVELDAGHLFLFLLKEEVTGLITNFLDGKNATNIVY
jgi:poly(3-hydroxyalkanoate) depolymerase